MMAEDLLYKVHFASILLEEDGFGRHLEDTEISCKLSLRLDCYKCNLHKSTLYKKNLLHFIQCRDVEILQMALPFIITGSLKKKVTDFPAPCSGDVTNQTNSGGGNNLIIPGQGDFG
jgi:hypothetical protein